MRYYIAADGGGTKLQAILYDENLHIVRKARMRGVNSNFKPIEQITSEMRQLADDLIPENISEIEGADVCIVRDTQLFFNVLKEKCSIREQCIYNEGENALAAAGVRYGVVAQAGTGSDALLIQPDVNMYVGGWGAQLGDEGGGYDIGIRSLKAAIYAFDGRGSKTVILDMIMEEWKLEEPRQMIRKLVETSDYRNLVASVNYITAKAAWKGDEVALGIYDRAAHELSLQVMAAIDTNGGVFEGPVVASGGVWKGHPRMFETFREDIRAKYPVAEVICPVFDPVVGCVVLRCFTWGLKFKDFGKIILKEFQEFLYQ